MRESFGHTFSGLPEAPPNGPEATPLNCNEYCDYSHNRDAWLASKDQWFCTDCLVDYWLSEIETWVGAGSLEEWTFAAHADEYDAFSHFVILDAGGKQATITLRALERARAAEVEL